MIGIVKSLIRAMTKAHHANSLIALKDRASKKEKRAVETASKRKRRVIKTVIGGIEKAQSPEEQHSSKTSRKARKETLSRTARISQSISSKALPTTTRAGKGGSERCRLAGRLALISSICETVKQQRAGSGEGRISQCFRWGRQKLVESSFQTIWNRDIFAKDRS